MLRMQTLRVDRSICLHASPGTCFFPLRIVDVFAGGIFVNRKMVYSYQ